MTHGLEPAGVPPGTSRADGLRRALVASFDAAALASGSVLERDFEIAGERVRLRSATASLVDQLSRAFSHLGTSSPGTPALTVNLWDSESHATIPPPTPEAGGELAPGAFFHSSVDGLRLGYQLGTSGDARVLAAYREAPTPAVSVLDDEHGEAWHWVADARRYPYWEQATPIRFLLDWWLRDRGTHVLHAGAVGTSEGGVLLVGKSGSGKSTAALSSLRSQLLYAADDFVAVSVEPEPWIHSLYVSGKLMPDHLRLLPFLRPALANDDQLDFEKAVVYVHEHWPENVSSGFPLRAILAPRVVPGRAEARAVPASPLGGLAALAPSTVFQLHTRGRDSLARMRQLAETVPSYVLETGSDIGSIPDAIAGVLGTLR